MTSPPAPRVPPSDDDLLGRAMRECQQLHATIGQAHAAVQVLLDAGDITPQGARLLTTILEGTPDE